ncbi:MAG: LysR family transcriptional regulator [Rhizobiales bacterium]|nr:LysR family transcriptional regulator [Hyphomicrobiales bacterium]
MATRFYGLPPFTSLAAFEAAARHLSMKTAATELNVTPGAVSHQIKALEADVSTALFRRVHRGVELTQAGEDLYAVLARSFNQTATILERLRAGENRSAVTLGATTAIASLWLMPRIAAFWREYPDVRINHQISDTPFDLARADVELAVRYGHGNWQGTVAKKLFDDTIIPVCSPEFSARHGKLDGAELAELPLIQMESLNRDWTTWPEWFRALDIATGTLKGPKYNNYSITLQAAADGVGVALGWRQVIKTYLEAGTLVPCTNLSFPSPGSFFLTWNSRDALSPAAKLIRDWLLDENT